MINRHEKFGIKQLSDHFWLHEFRCRCRIDTCNKTLIDTDLIGYLEDKRAEINKDNSVEKPVIVLSGYRCRFYNKIVGGAQFSQHLEGKAADIWVPGQSMVGMADKYFYDAHGLGIYFANNYLHVDVRPSRARWSK